MNRRITAATAGRIFFPQCRELGIDSDDSLSPGALKKVVYAGAQARSFARAARDLAVQAELSVSAERVRRATERIGAERVAERGAEVARWRALPLPEQRRSPHDHIPQVACVQPDGRARADSRTDR